MLKDNPKIRDAVHEAFGKRCFYTGRPVSREEMVIDHLIPLAKGGTDSIDNYVLTFADLNAGKGAKINDKILRMTGIVETVYAPRVMKLLKERRCPVVKKSNEAYRIPKLKFKPFRGSHKAPEDQR